MPVGMDLIMLSMVEAIHCATSVIVAFTPGSLIIKPLLLWINNLYNSVRRWREWVLLACNLFDSVHSTKCMKRAHICQKKRNISASLCHMMGTNVDNLDHKHTLLSTTCGRHTDDKKNGGTWLLPKCLVWWMEFYSTNKHLRDVEQNELPTIVDARKRERPIRPGFVGWMIER